MDKSEFEPLIELKIQDLVALVMDRENNSFEQALRYVYESELFKYLTDESTKLWHLSTEKLLDMLIGEKENKQLIFSDYV
jgi:hypothetical protein